MPAIDPTTTAQLVASLAALADDRLFGLEVAPSRVRLLNRRYPAATALVPQPGEAAWLVGYAMLYRRQQFRGQMVVGQANVDTAKGLLALDAQFQVQKYDLDHPWTQYTPGGAGVQSGP